MPELTEELVAEAKHRAEVKIEGILEQCRSRVTGDYDDCTCPTPMPTENQLIAEYLNLALASLYELAALESHR